MTEKGISMQAIKVAPNRPVHFTGFFTLGADKPFIMVENLDTYDEIVKLLRGRKHAKLFGIKVGGVIFWRRMQGERLACPGRLSG